MNNTFTFATYNNVNGKNMQLRNEREAHTIDIEQTRSYSTHTVNHLFEFTTCPELACLRPKMNKNKYLIILSSWQSTQSKVLVTRVGRIFQSSQISLKDCEALQCWYDAYVTDSISREHFVVKFSPLWNSKCIQHMFDPQLG